MLLHSQPLTCCLHCAIILQDAIVTHIDMPVPALDATNKKYAVEVHRGSDRVRVTLARSVAGSNTGVGELGAVIDSIRAHMGQQPRIFPGDLLAEVSCGPQCGIGPRLALLQLACWEPDTCTCDLHRTGLVAEAARTTNFVCARRLSSGWALPPLTSC